MDAFPNETREYRAARIALLESEAELRRHMESVAAELRALPPGGEIPEDYAFDCVGGSRPVGISELFRGGDTLMIYQFMFPRHVHDRRPRPSDGIFSALPHDEGPCPSCTALIDSWEGMKCYPSLTALPAALKPDIVDIFRKSADALPVVNEAVQIGAPYIVLQQGIVNPEARRIAEAAGAGYLEDVCLAVLYQLHGR